MRIHQALHGYDGGHRLLAASIPLPPAATRQLLDLTDANDVGEDPEFPSLIAGFPLAETNFYALAKTWPAPQSQRVGSVWTHTLLIDLLAPPSSAKSLMAAFVRPKPGEFADFYLPLEMASWSGRRPAFPEDLSTILWAIYEPPVKPVIAVLVDIDPLTRQSFLLSLILQQGAALGKGFAFAEAPRWPRTIAGRPFDLHITGTIGVSDVRQGVGDSRLVTREIQAAPPSWASLAMAELESSEKFGEFIRSWAPDLPNGRMDFPALVAVWENALQDDHDQIDDSRLKMLIRLIDRAFPRRGEMAQLKVAAFGAPSSRLLISRPDSAVLAVLAKEPSARCVSIPEMRIDERIGDLWTKNPKAGLSVLHSINVERTSDMGKAIASASIPHLPSDAFDPLVAERPRLWAQLLAIEPEIAAETDLKLLAASEIDLLVGCVDEITAGSAARRRAIAALARQAPRRWGKTLRGRFLGEVESDPTAFIAGSVDLESWLPGLPQKAIAEWLNSGAATPKDILAAALHFTVSTAHLVEESRWLSTAEALSKLDVKADPQALITLLAVAGASKSPPADALAVRILDRLWPVIGSLPSSVRTEVHSLNGSKDEKTPATEVLSIVAKGFRRFPEWRPCVVLELDSDVALRELLEEDSRCGGRPSSISYRLVESLPISGMTGSQYEVLQASLARHAKRDDLLGMLESVVRRVTGF